MNSTPTRYTLKELCEFCITNKKRRGFHDHTDDQIAQAIIEANAKNILYVIADDDGVCGVCIAEVYGDTLYIHQIVCIRNGFKFLVAGASKRFPGLQINGERNNRLKTFWKA